MNSLKLLFVAGLAATAASALTVTPPANTWARHGHNATLECRASDPGVRSSCTWATPYGATFTLEAGLTAEGGRLRQEGRDNGCALVISGVEERDEGAWMCTLAVVKDSEVTSATGRSKLTLAKKPTSVRLAGTVVSKKISTNSNDEAIDCIVSDAAPKPNFSWFVGEDEIEGNTVDNQKGQEWIQTLKYYPDSAHANQTLRCVVEHIGFDEKDDKEAGVVLRFTEDVKASSTTGFFEGYREVVRRTGNDTSVVIPYVLVGFACLLFGSAVYFGVHKAKTCWRERAEGAAAAAGAAVAEEDAEKTANAEDVESQQSGEKKDEKKDEEKSVSEEEKTDEEAKPNGRFQWVPKFLIPKTKSANKESAADEVDIEKPATDEEINASTAENKGFVAIDVNEDKTENDGEEKKTEEGEEKADSVKEVNEEEDDKAARPSFAARVAKMLRKSSKSQPKNETEMSEEVQKEETEKEEESKAEEKPETEEKVEMEETSKTAEVEVEEKTGPKNTDV